MCEGWHWDAGLMARQFIGPAFFVVYARLRKENVRAFTHSQIRLVLPGARRYMIRFWPYPWSASRISIPPRIIGQVIDAIAGR